jgi:hypothetical protein
MRGRPILTFVAPGSFVALRGFAAGGGTFVAGFVASGGEFLSELFLFFSDHLCHGWAGLG